MSLACPWHSHNPLQPVSLARQRGASTALIEGHRAAASSKPRPGPSARRHQRRRHHASVVGDRRDFPSSGPVLRSAPTHHRRPACGSHSHRPGRTSPRIRPAMRSSRGRANLASAASVLASQFAMDSGTTPRTRSARPTMCLFILNDPRCWCLRSSPMIAPPGRFDPRAHAPSRPRRGSAIRRRPSSSPTYVARPSSVSPTPG